MCSLSAPTKLAANDKRGEASHFARHSAEACVVSCSGKVNARLSSRFAAIG